MFKKLIIFSFLIFVLIGCGTDYFYSSFYLRKDLQWLASPENQKDINDYIIFSDTSVFNEYTSPVILSTPANYILAVYEYRKNPNSEVLAVNGQNVVNVKVSISLNSQYFEFVNNNIGNIANSATTSHGSPIGFVNRDGHVVVLAVGGIGFGDGSANEISKISVSISSNNGSSWTDWKDLDSSIFKPLVDKGYNRFYTTSGNGVVLGNGTLACMIDFKKHTDIGSSPAGAAIIYSTNGGEDWQLGGTMLYSGNYRFAKIIAERKDGSLLIAATTDTGNNYKSKGPIYWAIAKTRDSIEPLPSVTGLPENSGGNISGGKININENISGLAIQKNVMILLHSWPEREFIGGNGKKYTVYNSSAISISEDEGQTWKMVTNIVGKDPAPEDRATFRQTMTVFKDGTIGTLVEEGKASEIDPNQGGYNSALAYKRNSIYLLSGGKYSYSGI